MDRPVQFVGRERDEALLNNGQRGIRTAWDDPRVSIRRR